MVVETIHGAQTSHRSWERSPSESAVAYPPHAWKKLELSVYASMDEPFVNGTLERQIGHRLKLQWTLLRYRLSLTEMLLMHVLQQRVWNTPVPLV